MAAAAQQAPERASQVARGEGGVKRALNKLLTFWTKMSNDWIFNWSAMLAYVFLTSIFSILLAIVSIGGLILSFIAPESRSALEAALANSLPGGESGYGGQIVTAATGALRRTAGIGLAIGIVLAFVSGSGLFTSLENVFGVIFRLRGRDALHQRLMAIGMLLLYAVLVPLIVLASVVPPLVLRVLAIGSDNPVGAFLIQAAGLGVSLLVGIVLFGAIYIVVPNRPVRIREVWIGTLVAAVLLVLYELLFPIYESMFLKPGNLGSTVGFAVVILAFFYYLAFILLLGAEINSWAAGQRETSAPIDAILHEVQAHNTTRGAAGPTAGNPSEDLQEHRGAEAMRDTSAAIRHERREHEGDTLPPRYAESGVTGSGYSIEDTGTAGQLANISDEHERGNHGDDSRVVQGFPQAESIAKREGGAQRPPEQHAPHTTPELQAERKEAEPTYAELAGRRAELATAPRLDARGRNALLALLATGAVVVTGVLRFLYVLIAGSEGKEERRTRAMD
ncbi:MAG TPA: YihY/virulence factor BrkB family protein [Ktedonobacterales bacterium]|nr:YihY/virulence factor BrkB family protein [Ktedonobacterales bacterium]